MSSVFVECLYEFIFKHSSIQRYLLIAFYMLGFIYINDLGIPQLR